MATRLGEFPPTSPNPTLTHHQSNLGFALLRWWGKWQAVLRLHHAHFSENILDGDRIRLHKIDLHHREQAEEEFAGMREVTTERRAHKVAEKLRRVV